LNRSLKVKGFFGVVLLYSIFIAQNIYAQEPFESVITNTYNSYLGWYGYNQAEVLPLRDNGYLVKDYIASTAYTPLVTARITRFNKCHNKVWCKTLDSVFNNFGSGLYNNNLSLTETSDHCLISCNIMLRGSYGSQVVVTKMDSAGNKIWTRKLYKYVPPNKIAVCSNLNCTSTANGGVLIVFTGYNSSQFDTFPLHFISVTKLDKNGKLFNSSTISGAFNNPADSRIDGELQKMPDGGFLIFLEHPDSKNYIIQHVLKIDSNGNFRWVKKMNNPFNHYGVISYGRASGAIDSKGNIYISGNYGTANNIFVNYIEKADFNGNPLWFDYILDSLGSMHFFVAGKLGISNDDKIGVLCHYEYGSNLNYYSHVFLRVSDVNDSFLYAKTIKNYRHFWDYNGSQLHQTVDSGFLLLDNDISYSYSNNFNNLTLLKFDKDGKSPCLEKDSIISFQHTKFTTGYEGAFSDTGFTPVDTLISFKNSRFKEKIICSTRFFPIADISPDTILCAAASYTLYAGAENIGSKIRWSTGDTGANTTVTKSGKYWIRLSSGYCTSTDTVIVIFRDQIKTGLVKKQSICPYDSIPLEVKDTLASYYWIKPDKTIAVGRRAMAKDSGNYYLMLANTKACAALDTVHISYYGLPKGTAGPDTTLCLNQSYTMQGAGGITYLWIPSKYLSSATDPRARAKLPNTQLYDLIVNNKQGCKDTSHVMLKVRPKLILKLMPITDSACYGQDINLKAKGMGGDSLHYSYKWSDSPDSGSASSQKVFNSGWHKVILSDNCSPDLASDSLYITVIPRAKAAFSFIPGNPVKLNHTLNFQNKSQNASAWLWIFDATDSSRIKSPVYTYTDTGNYEVKLVAYGLEGCPNDTTVENIRIIDGTIAIYIPNVFSPDGNTINDLFEIKGTGIKDYSMSIFNRWGELIYDKKSSTLNSRSDLGWDGTFKGAPVPEGVYLYMVTVTDIFNDKHFLNGTVTIVK
jgi:gliding motility-associated-like protein